MAHQSILVVDDETDILELVEYNLTRAGYRAACVTTGESALARARSHAPDLIVLDLMLPGVDGLEVCRQLKAEPAMRAIPVVMLTARGEEADVVAGLELGADDYVVKPFSPRVLVARIRAVLRRRQRWASDDANRSIAHGEIVVDPGRHEVAVAGEPVALTATEFRILHALARRPGWVFTRNQLVNLAQGPDAVVTDRTVDVHIVAIRRKLGGCGDYIETVRGIGYRMKDV